MTVHTVRCTVRCSLSTLIYIRLPLSFLIRPFMNAYANTSRQTDSNSKDSVSRLLPFTHLHKHFTLTLTFTLTHINTNWMLDCPYCTTFTLFFLRQSIHLTAYTYIYKFYSSWMQTSTPNSEDICSKVEKKNKNKSNKNALSFDSHARELATPCDQLCRTFSFQQFFKQFTLRSPPRMSMSMGGIKIEFENVQYFKLTHLPCIAFSLIAVCATNEYHFE